MATTYNVIKGTNGLDILNGTSKPDKIYGLKGQDSINGGRGDDWLYGDAGDDTIEGNSGSDRLHGGAGADELRGGSGNDILYAGGNSGGNDDILYGDDGNDTLYGSSTLGTSTLGNCTLIGGNGNDTFYALTKGTSIDGGDGNDLIYAGMGTPMKETYISGFDGGDGNDTISFIKAKSGVITELNYFDLYYQGRHIEPGGAAEGERYHRNIENIVGSNYKDELWGGEEINKISGGKGNDFIDGLEGSDVLTGGSGADTFHFYSIYTNAAANRDVITDFSRSQGDKIDLHDIDANTKVANDQKFSYIGDNAFSGKAGELRFHKGVVSADDDGDGVADFFITVKVDALHASDFIL